MERRASRKRGIEREANVRTRAHFVDSISLCGRADSKKPDLTDFVFDLFRGGFYLTKHSFANIFSIT
jgi:hypothetical protein